LSNLEEYLPSLFNPAMPLTVATLLAIVNPASLLDTGELLVDRFPGLAKGTPEAFAPSAKGVVQPLVSHHFERPTPQAAVE
jgi:hypothetical protein